MGGGVARGGGVAAPVALRAARRVAPVSVRVARRVAVRVLRPSPQ